MKYDEITMEKIRAVPIFEVCSKLGITLKGKGKLTKKALCWYHNDTHPSMQVSKKKNLYKCFVCGEGGDVIKLVQDHENLDFIAACDWLVKEFNVVVVANQKVVGDLKSPTSAVGDLQSPPPPKPHHVVPLDTTLVTKSRGIASDFCKAVVATGYLSEGQLHHAAERYQLGYSKEGGVIFWEIDEQQQVHTGKIMYYQADCHRDKSHTPTWVHAILKNQLPADYELQHCLFGQHLLTSTKASALTERKIAIVESEKTAVIMSEKFTDFVWLSCGGMQMLTPELLAPLVQYRIIIFPDADPQGEAYRQWAEIVNEAQRLYHFRYPIRLSPLLEQKATMQQKERKIDIVDFLFEQDESHV